MGTTRSDGPPLAHPSVHRVSVTAVPISATRRQAYASTAGITRRAIAARTVKPDITVTLYQADVRSAHARNRSRQISEYGGQRLRN